MISNRKLKNAMHFARVFLQEAERHLEKDAPAQSLSDAVSTRKLHEASRTLQRSLKTLSGERKPQ